MNEQETIAQLSSRKGRLLELVTAVRAVRAKWPDPTQFGSEHKLIATLYAALDRFDDMEAK